FAIAPLSLRHLCPHNPTAKPFKKTIEGCVKHTIKSHSNFHCKLTCLLCYGATGGYSSFHLQEFLHHVRLRHAQVLSDANSAKRDQPLALSQGRVVLVYKGCSTLFISLILPQYPISVAAASAAVLPARRSSLTQSLTMGKPKEKFDAAVGVIRSLPKEGAFKPSNELLLRLYSLYKQATEGPCRQPRPASGIRSVVTKDNDEDNSGAAALLPNGVSGGGVEERSEAD
uniref:ACB domain-containing protein n=1 Tax=Macrostomum lignano TaxID=282301 RepID=A0A1I8JR26_9PLAT